MQFGVCKKICCHLCISRWHKFTCAYTVPKFAYWVRDKKGTQNRVGYSKKVASRHGLREKLLPQLIIVYLLIEINNYHRDISIVYNRRSLVAPHRAKPSSSIINRTTMQLANAVGAITVDAGLRDYFVYHQRMEGGDVPEDVTHFRINSSVRAIGGWAFCDHRRLRIVTLGNGLEEVGTNAFKYCTSMEEIVILHTQRRQGY